MMIQNEIKHKQYHVNDEPKHHILLIKTMTTYNILLLISINFISLLFLHNFIVSSFSFTPRSSSYYSIPSTLHGIYKNGRRSIIRKRKNNKLKLQNETISIDIPKEYVDNVEMMEWYVHERLMDEALNEARKAGEIGEVPIGAIVVKEKDHDDMYKIDNVNNKKNKKEFIILSKGQNQIETIKDASAHAELQALRKASSNIQNWRLINTTLYTTLEPCPMCLSASQAFRVSKVVYGAPDLRLGAIETHIQLLDIVKHPFHDCMEVVGGVKKNECGQLLVDFFRERRKQSNKEKVNNKKSNSSNNTMMEMDNKNINKRSKLKKLLTRIYQKISLKSITS